MKPILTLALLVLMVLGSLIILESRFQGITNEQGDAILTELKSIRQELNAIKQKGLARPGKAVLSVAVSTVGEPMLGDSKAPVTLVEFTDYQCPFCQQFYSRAYKELKKDYIDPGKLRLVLRDLPLPSHQYARPAAMSTHCAGEQSKFWEMHDALFEGGGKLNRDDILSYATSLGLKIDSFESCLTSGRYKRDIDLDINDARNVGIKGTPSFVVGRTTDNLVEGILIRGNRPYTAFKAEIDKLLTSR
ncbi:MAG: DsbA family protein [Nitrospina sp.]|jgi:protein-disulfide isomerase|nr:DsbA family protein [Nitrospina sp.]MBT3510233.1 DsbA family protein [Nitrospina sp.]MBT3876798.1 DsbA family protein [Nitrospina sp.]MBT4048154.1 DsbA family protein [Nitrospina sp.]MBT4556840.1 DsbA family protein [Nitrospina sp.]